MAIKVISSKELRDELATVLAGLNEFDDVVITRRGHGAAVLVDLNRYNELMERLEYLEDSIDAAEAPGDLVEAEQFFAAVGDSSARDSA